MQYARSEKKESREDSTSISQSAEIKDVVDKGQRSSAFLLNQQQTRKEDGGWGLSPVRKNDISIQGREVCEDSDGVILRLPNRF